MGVKSACKKWSIGRVVDYVYTKSDKILAIIFLVEHHISCSVLGYSRNWKHPQTSMFLVENLGIPRLVFCLKKMEILKIVKKKKKKNIPISVSKAVKDLLIYRHLS